MIVFTWYAVVVMAVFVYGPFLAGIGWAISFYWRRIRLAELLLLVAYFPALLRAWCAHSKPQVLIA
jgi:hypothetical protein